VPFNFAQIYRTFNGTKPHATLFPAPSDAENSIPSSSGNRLGGMQAARNTSGGPMAGQAGAAPHTRTRSNVSKGDHGTRTRRNVTAARSLLRMRAKRPQLQTYLLHT
jgi:hypothetical protein